MEIRVAHGLSREEAARRMRDAARNIEARTEDDEGGLGGSLVKDTPLGSITARWEAAESEVVVTIVSKPKWLPDKTVRAPLESGLREALTD